MLRRRPCRSRLRGHRLYALALARKYQASAIVAQRACPVGVPERPRKPRHIRSKSRFACPFVLAIHVSTSRANPESSQIVDSQSRSVRPSDSVRQRRSSRRAYLLRSKRSVSVLPAICDGGHAEFIIGRAFARPVGFAHPTT